MLAEEGGITTSGHFASSAYGLRGAPPSSRATPQLNDCWRYQRKMELLTLQLLAISLPMSWAGACSEDYASKFLDVVRCAKPSFLTLRQLKQAGST